MILALPLMVRLVGLFALGTLLGGWINLATYRLAWQPRAFSPWGTPPLGAKRTAVDRIPLVGWWRLRRESKLHGPGFWLRPLVVELFVGLMLPALYWWEVEHLGLYTFVRLAAPPVGALVNTDFQTLLHAQFATHALLFCLMLVATLIDLDEQTIPDAITVPGALAGLTLAALYPWSLLPADVWNADGQRAVEPLTLISPEGWDAALAGWPVGWPLVAAIGAWTLWCGGLLERRLRLRHGLVRGLQFFFYRLSVDPRTWRTAIMWAIGSVAIVAVAALAPVANWAGLFSALAGLAVGGGVIWVVRIIGGAALGREAMGFGDVTLMAMIGTFVGWQGALVVFFLAPLMGVLLALIRRIASGDNEIPYGPFLCLAAAALIVDWAHMWDATRDIFLLGWILGAVLGAGLALMGVLLLAYRAIGQRFGRP